LAASARDARDTTTHHESRVFASGTQTPRWLATATCVVDEQRTVFQWLTNDAMRAPIARVLERGIGELAENETPAPSWVDRGLTLRRIEIRFDALSSYLDALSYQVDCVLPAGTLAGTGVFLLEGMFFEASRSYSIGWLVPAIPTLVLDDVVRRACDEVPWGALVTRTHA
jgi:hypothetical protein